MLFTIIIIFPGLPISAVTEEKEAFPSPDDFVELGIMPEMIYQETPIYPETALESGIEGTVWVQALVKSDGAVAMVRLLKTSGIESLDQSALAAAQKCKYKPGYAEKDKPVAAWVSYRVDFVLDKGKTKQEENPTDR